MKHVAYLVLIVAGVFLSCNKPPETVIARVGDEVLTLEQALLAVDSSRGAVDRQVQAYAASWVTNELLHQEALKEGVNSTEEFEQHANDAVRQLAVQAFLDKHIYADTLAAGDSLLQTYFSAHASDFFLREDIRKMNMAVFAVRERAGAFASALSQGVSWNKALAQSSSSADGVSAILISETGQYYTKRTITPPELWKVAVTLTENETSFPVKTTSGYVVMQLLRAMREGFPAEFDVVRDEVRQRVQLEYRRQRYETLLASLRSKYPVQLFFPLTDTAHAQPSE